MELERKKENPLGTEPLPKLLLSLAIPAIIAHVVNALYNIVDQIFIGQGVGKLGNAATTIAFPLTTICMAIGLMVGLGSAAGFNLELGRKNEKKARQIAGTAAGILLISGIVICTVVRLNLENLLIMFGATENILPYAKQYAGITSLGIPFFLLTTGVNPLVRADRSPVYSMAAIVSGAVLNTILDPIFIFVFDWGISGAAWATIISQITSATILMLYYPKFKSVRFGLKDFVPKIGMIFLICKLGINSLIYQTSNLIAQILLNKMLKEYGGKSIYGADTAIAVAGIVVKINVIFFALIIGLINGAQPICSYNYGAKKYSRVKGTIKLFMSVAVVISTAMWVIFEAFPSQIISIFGSGGDDPLYMEFGVRYMRMFLFFVFLNGVQICTATFFPSIGKGGKGAMLSFSKQFMFLIPMIIILPKLFGLKGLMFAQPVTDLLTFFVAMFFMYNEVKNMPADDPKYMPQKA
ncbi:MAG: MATE family efflux transporter [Lachnospiraceae bacterium]|nr:MATE family efflux transporter [Lachnospiraceae bacterium]